MSYSATTARAMTYMWLFGISKPSSPPSLNTGKTSCYWYWYIAEYPGRQDEQRTQPTKNCIKPPPIMSCPERLIQYSTNKSRSQDTPSHPSPQPKHPFHIDACPVFPWPHSRARKVLTSACRVPLPGPLLSPGRPTPSFYLGLPWPRTKSRALLVLAVRVAVASIHIGLP